MCFFLGGNIGGLYLANVEKLRGLYLGINFESFGFLGRFCRH